MGKQQNSTSQWELKKNWLLLVFFALHIFIMFQTETIQAWFTLPVESRGGEGIPWNDINRDFAKGVGSLIMFLLASALILPVLKKCWPISWMTLFYAGLYAVSDLTVLGLILLNTQNYFDPVNANAAWHSWREYFDAKDIGFWAMVFYGVLGLLNLYYVKWEREEIKKKTGMYFPPKNTVNANLP